VRCLAEFRPLTCKQPVLNRCSRLPPSSAVLNAMNERVKVSMLGGCLCGQFKYRLGHPKPFQLDLDRLQANLELARATEERAKEEVSIAADRISSQQAQLDDAKVAFERATDLRKLGNIAQQSLDDARRNFDVATALLRAAQASRVTAEQEVFVQAASVTAARAAVARAKYDLDCTVLFAPVTGHVAPLIVRVGDYLTAGRPVAAIVSDENWRLVVNLPERHLKGLKVGQSVYCYIEFRPLADSRRQGSEHSSRRGPIA